jgi:hypothetical protein
LIQQISNENHLKFRQGKLPRLIIPSKKLWLNVHYLLTAQVDN